MNAFPATQKFYFSPPGSTVAATVEMPENRCCRRVVLMAGPVFEERKGTLRFLSGLSRRLALDGCLVARCDVRGSGYSGGLFEDLSEAAWQDDLRATLDALRGAAPDLPVYLFGVRIAAAWMMRLAASAPGIAGVAVAAPVSGERFVRQLLQRAAVNRMLTHGEAASPAKLAREAGDGAVLDLDGYAVPPGLFNALRQTGFSPWNGPALLATTQHDGPDAEAAKAALTGRRRDAGTVLPAFWNTVGQVDTDVLAAPVAAWLAEQAAAPETVAAGLPPHPCDSPATSTLGRVMGFRSAPAGAPGANVLFIHGWSGDGTGPHRMFTKLARRLVADGCLCHQMDLGGRGESDGAHGDASIATMTEDAHAALRSLRAANPEAPTVIVAICSGSKVALSLVAREPETPASLILCSAEPLGSLRASSVAWRRFLHAAKTYAVKLSSPATWKKVLAGKVQAGGVRASFVTTEKPSPDETKRENAVLKKLRGFKGALLFIYAGRDPEAAPASRAYRAFCMENALDFDMRTVPDSGHSFYSLDAEQAVIEAAAGFVQKKTNASARAP